MTWERSSSLTIRITDFLLPWQEVTAVHQFARLVADEMFLQDTEGPYIHAYERDGSGNLEPQRYLPVDCALLSYGLVNVDDMFLVPASDGEWVKDRDRNIRSWQGTRLYATITDLGLGRCEVVQAPYLGRACNVLQQHDFSPTSPRPISRSNQHFRAPYH